MSNYIELAKKIKALADKGEPGEKENAEAKLKLIMSKYGIKEEMLSDDVLDMFCLNIEKEFERMILHQLTGQHKVKMYGKFPKKVQKEYYLNGNYAIECTKLQFLEIKAKHDFYTTRYLSDLEIFNMAFLMKNNLLVTPEDEEMSLNEMSDKELIDYKKALKLSLNLDENIFYKTLK